MKKYYININAYVNGDYEVHSEHCVLLPTEVNRAYLGNFSSGQKATEHARELYRLAIGCRLCVR
ncbi:hypothetical protein E2P86_08810 [Sphingobacterium psychroaquaticum]|uniref:Uncharacterized protein n=1 Tax=Sphingobacterium psychroaquaticum TaxID=561061 RepID=A0A1X7JYW5_9SPHI|nr:hypothetical protein E2P86_08810 [Sphingobacterium psychroaquaticum]SMG32974.1 hypothetical protein SAMN05660862_2303 [Sphingobacterium psychroaquaticum]